MCCAPPRFPEFAQRQARNSGLFARNESTGAVNGVKGGRETNHTKELRKTSSKINRYRIINRHSKISAYIEQEYYCLSKTGQSFAGVKFILQALGSPPPWACRHIDPAKFVLVSDNNFLWSQAGEHVCSPLGDSHIAPCRTREHS